MGVVEFLNTGPITTTMIDIDKSVEELMKSFYSDTYSTDQFYTLAGNAIPVPAAAWLFGSALLGLVGIKRRQ